MIVIYCRHRPIRPVIVNPLWVVVYIPSRNTMPSFLVHRVPTLRPLFFCRSCRVKMGPRPSCSSSFRESGLTNKNVSIHFLRSEPPAVHHGRCGMCSLCRFENVLSSKVKPSLSMSLACHGDAVWNGRATENNS